AAGGVLVAEIAELAVEVALDLIRLVLDRAVEIDAVDDVKAALEVEAEVDLALEPAARVPLIVLVVEEVGQLVGDERRREHADARDDQADQPDRAPLQVAVHGTFT